MSRHVVARAGEVAPGTCKLVTAWAARSASSTSTASSTRSPTAARTRAPSCAAAWIVGLVQSDGPGEYRLTRQGEFLRCPWHGWEFDIRTGQSWCDPQVVRARNFKVKVEPGAELVKGPYVAETFPVTVEEDYLVIDL